ncbi:hypothetical protein CHUAL_008261 [Chamberlinius hualienensis]
MNCAIVALLFTWAITQTILCEDKKFDHNLNVRQYLFGGLAIPVNVKDMFQPISNFLTSSLPFGSGGDVNLLNPTKAITGSLGIKDLPDWSSFLVTSTSHPTQTLTNGTEIGSKTVDNGFISKLLKFFGR